MTDLLKKLQRVLTAAISITLLVPYTIVCPITSADEDTITLVGDVYEFGEKSEYEIDSSNPIDTSDKSNAIGTLKIKGDMSKTESVNGFDAYEVADDELFTIKFNYISSLAHAAKTEWHLENDSKKTVNDIKLDDKIDRGAFIYQTSLDGVKWVNTKIYTDLSKDIEIKKNKGINDIQLINGCYYRIIVAYKTGKLTNGYFNPTDLFNTEFDSYDYQKYAEVYTFYASYKKPEDEVKGEKYYFTVGPTEKYTKKTKKNDYSGSEKVDSKDPHYGWELGKFCLSGYTDKGDSEDVFLKTVGNKVKLSFSLDTDINKLNKKDNLMITNDKNGSDSGFQIPAHDMGHGELIVKYTDSENKSKITQYSNYLESLSSPSADTTIKLFEEGDYEVHLDYAIKDTSGIDSTTYYRTSFSFKIRNGNCMVYTFDTATNSELANKDITENGFRIDSAKSSYPKITIKKEVLNDGATGMTEDTRFNRAASDGEEFTEEGIYTVTAVNRFNDQLKTEKIIYVGTNEILNAYVKHYNEKTKEYEYSIEEINRMVNEDHAEIQSNGDIVIPAVNEEITDSSFEDDSSVVESTSLENSVVDSVISDKDERPVNNKLYYVGGGAVILVLMIITISRSGKKKKVSGND